jgi:cardiolipin synthase (CMP-forming)
MSDAEAMTSRVLTVPNLLSSLRIVLIPVFVFLIVHRETSRAGLVVLGLVSATDWVDGYLARRTGQVSDLGKILDPVADRLAIAAGLIALVVRGVFPWWAALPILLRDAAILAVGAIALTRNKIRIDVRFVGKAATFSLMVAIVAVSWGNLGMPLPQAFLALGWVAYGLGIVEYAVATAAYVDDLRRALAA